MRKTTKSQSQSLARLLGRFDYGQLTERAMGMTDTVWLRHANPWSVWTRIATFPFLFLALCSTMWIGWWGLLPLTAIAIWIWLNPRLFPPPKRFDRWSARGVLGERVWLNRAEVPIPDEIRRLAHGLSAASAVSLVLGLCGFWGHNIWMAFAGMSLAFVFKLWFVDRMALLYDRMKELYPPYAAWSLRDDPHTHDLFANAEGYRHGSNLRCL